MTLAKLDEIATGDLLRRRSGGELYFVVRVLPTRVVAHKLSLLWTEFLDGPLDAFMLAQEVSEKRAATLGDMFLNDLIAEGGVEIVARGSEALSIIEAHAVARRVEGPSGSAVVVGWADGSFSVGNARGRAVGRLREAP